MPDVVVADAGPLIGLARASQLVLLRELYGTITVPPTVAAELRPNEDRPGSKALRKAMEEGWLRQKALRETSELGHLRKWVDLGEAEAILLAGEVDLRFLLIDEARGRRVARQRGISVVGTGGILVTAKRNGLLQAVRPLLEDLSQSGYRLSHRLREQILALAEET